MKKIVCIVIASLVLCGIGFAEIRLIEQKKIKTKDIHYMVSTICVDGYKFVISPGFKGKSMVQFFEERNEKSVPAKC
jgi:hypothetical protein